MLQKSCSPAPSHSTVAAHLSRFLAAALTLVLGLSAPAPARAAEPDIEDSCARYAADGLRVDECVDQLRLAREASAKYRDPLVALRDGFVPTECSDSTSEGKDPAIGGMGEHWNRIDRMADDKLDPREPEQLLYLNTPQGRRLMAVEWSVPALEGGLPHYGTEPPDPGRIPPPPQMFGGRAFNGPMQGHNLVQAWNFDTHLTPQPWHYDLHVWLWEENPDGIFAQYNRRVSCKDGLAPEGTGGSGATAIATASASQITLKLDASLEPIAGFCRIGGGQSGGSAASSSSSPHWNAPGWRA